MKFCSIFIPCKNKREARKIAKNLLEMKLVACANIIDGVESLFRWKGTVEAAKEVLLILKGRQSSVPEIIKKVRHLHSYECPVIEVLEIADGNQEFLRWIERETLK